jgi:pimeloyl-ACP methyl ester carboxylesterase
MHTSKTSLPRAPLLACVLLLLLAAEAWAGSSATGYVQVPGGKLWYEAKGEGPALVLLHDGLLPSVTWDGQFDELAKRFRASDLTRGPNDATRGSNDRLCGSTDVTPGARGATRGSNDVDLAGPSGEQGFGLKRRWSRAEIRAPDEPWRHVARYRLAAPQNSWPASLQSSYHALGA